MCVYYWVDCDKQKSAKAIKNILNYINEAFDNPNKFESDIIRQINEALAVRGQYDNSTRERLNFLLSDSQNLRDIIIKDAEKNKELFKTEGMARIGDITPVQTDMDSIKMMRFGILGFNNTTLFNVRSEDAEAKPTWKGPMLNTRCIIPTTQYIETYTDEFGSGKKVKYIFWLPEKKRIYMAGVWRQEESLFKRYAILTRQAVGEVEKIHGRMPVILNEEQAETWLKEGNKAFGNAIHRYAAADVEYERFNEAG